MSAVEDPYTSEQELCDGDGLVAGDHLALLNRLRAATGLKPWEGSSFPCTGHAHLAGEHIRCTSSYHSRQPKNCVLRNMPRDGATLVRVAREMTEFFGDDPNVPSDFIEDLNTVKQIGEWLMYSQTLTLPVGLSQKVNVFARFG